MPVMDEFKEEREAMKQRPFKERMKYFWSYYKWWVIGILAGVILVVLFVRDLVTKTEEALYVAMINYMPLDNSQTDFYDPFVERIELDTKEYHITFDTSMTSGLSTDTSTTEYTTATMIATYLYAGQMDLMLTNDEVFLEQAYQNIFLPLDTYLDSEDLEAYAPYFFYVDAAVVNAKTEASDNLQEYEGEIPDPTKPDQMQQPVAVGLIVNNSETLHNSYIMANASSTYEVIGLVANTSHTEFATELIEYILGSPAP